MIVSLCKYFWIGFVFCFRLNLNKYNLIIFEYNLIIVKIK